MNPEGPDRPPRKRFRDWFDAELVGATARHFEAVAPTFDGASFRALALDGLSSHEMMGRVGQIADALRATLPASVPEAMAVLVRALPPLPDGEPDPEGITSSGYLLWPWGEAIARYAATEPYSDDNAEAAFQAMLALTRRFTAEFAVRPWLAADPDRWLDRLEPLVTDPSEHVRRWVSEGTRTRLPWGKRVPALGSKRRTQRRLRILQALHRDASPYVRRSVANHLQDALRDHRDRAFPTLSNWASSGDALAVATARHAARGLLREGDAETLGLFGFPPGGGGVQLRHFTVSAPRARIGEAVEFQFRLEAPEAHDARDAKGAKHAQDAKFPGDAQEGGAPGTAGAPSGGRTARPPSTPLRLDLRMEHPGAGTRVRQKTFRVATLEVARGGWAERTYAHAFVDRTVRAVRPGRHRFVARLNGVDAGSVTVEVEAAAAASSTD